MDTLKVKITESTVIFLHRKKILCIIPMCNKYEVIKDVY